MIDLGGMREFALPYMTSPVAVYRPSIIYGAGDAYDVQYDYGDDEPVDPALDEGVLTPVAGGDPANPLLGWFFSTIQTNVSAGSGQVGTIDLHQLRLPWGTDILPLDQVKDLTTDEIYIVVDTNGEDTMADMLRVSLRRRE